jgi:hypothetical protein
MSLFPHTPLGWIVLILAVGSPDRRLNLRGIFGPPCAICAPVADGSFWRRSWLIRWIVNAMANP